MTITSKAIQEDSAYALLENGQYYILLEYGPGNWHGKSIDYEVLEKVRNIQICVTMPIGLSDHYQPFADVISPCNDPEVVFQRTVETMEVPKSCHVKFTLGTYQPLVLQTVHAMRWFSGFGRVDLEIYNGPWSRGDVVHLPGREPETDAVLVAEVKTHLNPRQVRGPVPILSIVHTNKSINLDPSCCICQRCRLSCT